MINIRDIKQRHLILLLVAICIFRIASSIVHPPTVQHDRLHHHQYVRSLAHGHYEKNYEGPYYYGIAAIHTIVSRTVRDSFFPKSYRRNVSNGIVATNTWLFVFLTIGLVQLFSLLTNERSHALLLTALSISFPVLHRSFNMARPENFMIVAMVWGLYLLLRLMNQEYSVRKSLFFLLGSSLLLALCVTQKITGIVACSSTLIAAFFCVHSPYKYRFKVLLLSILSIVVLSATLWWGQHALSGSRFYSHHEQCEPDCGPHDLSVLYRFSPSAVWTSPFRDKHYNSMLNILFADFYGDYWRYGIDAPLYGKRRPLRISRIRMGLIVCTLYCLLCLFCMVYLIRHVRLPQLLKPPFGSLALLSVPAAGYAFLLVACFVTPYRRSEFDLIKWEYILWAIPFLTVPILCILEIPHKRRLGHYVKFGCYLIILAGILQSTPLYHPWIMKPIRMFSSDSTHLE